MGSDKGGEDRGLGHCLLNHLQEKKTESSDLRICPTQGNIKNSPMLCNALDASHQFKRWLSEIGEGWRGQLGMQRFGSVSHLWFTKTRDQCRFWRHAFAAGRRRKKSSVSPLAGMRTATASAQEHPGGREGEVLDPGEEYFPPFLRLPKVFLSLFGICRKSYNSALPACMLHIAIQNFSFLPRYVKKASH